MVDAFPVSQRGVHVAVSTVGKVAKKALSFDSLKGSDYNLNEVKRRISQIPYERVDTTRLDLGLEQAAQEMFTEQNGMRQEASKVSAKVGRDILVLRRPSCPDISPLISVSPLNLITPLVTSRPLDVISSLMSLGQKSTQLDNSSPPSSGALIGQFKRKPLESL